MIPPAYYLKMSGYEVFCAKDGYEGLEMINSQSFDLVVLDLMLPKKDGFEILDKMIQEKRPNDVFVKRIKKVAKELGLRV